jgi:two-component system, NtrC family, nitrogen regulation sensor histidine kinase NtrY
MVSSPFRTGVALRVGSLFITLTLTAVLVERTEWYVLIGLLVAASIAQAVMLVQFATRSSREMARLLDAIAVDDTSPSFSALGGDSAHSELGSAMTRALARLRDWRSEREEQAHYFQALVAHVPVALISVDQQGRVQLLNVAARRLFETPIADAAQFARHGQPFAVSIEALGAGSSTILRMERTAGALLLKAAATDLSMRERRCRLISLQNIESEMSAHELAAWQTVVRVMSHEVMNSLTPVSSLAATAHELVREAVEKTPADDPRAATLADAHAALETVARRSEGLLHFVQNHHRLTRRLTAQVQVTPVQRVFARLQRLLAGELAGRGIQMTASVEPGNLELAVDVDLLDQALINLVRNAIDALRDTQEGLIDLTARRDPDGRIAIAVGDNGPGISPEQREKVFVPFYTTKRQGSGIGLTIVRQIATAHGARVDISAAPSGGALFTLRF